MTTTDVGPFRLVDPPAGQEDVIRAAIDAIDYPWDRLAPALADDPDGCVIVEWDDTGQGTSGLFYGYSLRIVLSTRFYHMDAGAGFVFAHEVGHLVDRADLRDEDRAVLMELMHSSAKTHRFNGQQMNGEEHPYSHQQPHDETWVSANDYLFRHNEAYADLFVEAFAPTIWDGSFYPGAPSKGPDWLRFVHTTDDLESVIRLTLWTPPTPDPRDGDVVATVNMKSTVPKGKAERGLRRALAGVDLAGLQEWGRGRNKILKRLDGWHWTRPLRGGGPVVARSSRYQHKRTRARLLARPGRVDRVKGRRTLLGPSWATLATYRDRAAGETVDVINFHLTAGVQGKRGRYRDDRPKRVRRHKREVAALSALAARRLSMGHRVYVVGDTNFDGLELKCLVSCWRGRDHVGTLGGNRAVDVIYAEQRADDVRLVKTASDHDHPVATYRG